MKQVRVKVLRAVNLIAADINGKSDPFVKITLATGKTFIEDDSTSLSWKTTPFKKKTLNPEWSSGTEFVFDVQNSKTQKLWFRLIDHDSIGANDDLGFATTSLLDLKENQVQTRTLTVTGEKAQESQLFVELEAIGGDSVSSFPPRKCPPEFRAKVTVGPLLNFRGQDLANKVWRVSMMIGVPSTDNTLEEHLITMEQKAVSGEKVYQTRNNQLSFLVYNLSIPQTSEEQQIIYTVDKIAFGFLVPAIGQNTRWAYWSCNGFQSLAKKVEYGGIQPLWKHLLKSGDLHMMYGGGDQLYMDGIVKDDKTSNLDHEGLFSLPLLQEWMVMEGVERLEAEFTPELNQSVYEFAVSQYIDQFTEPYFSDALSSLPSIMSWDDHDAWDGMGSYKHLNASKILQGMFPIMQELYLLFQHHTTVERAAVDCNMFGHTGFSTLHFIDDGKTALLSLDTRSERSASIILNSKSYDIAWERMKDEIMEETQHILFMLPIPVGYPDMIVLDTLFAAGDKVKFIDFFINRIPGMKNEFDYELRDDFLDHWNHSSHEVERDSMLRKAFEWNRTKRVTMVSGDVHHMAVGRLDMKGEELPIYNIICSAIGNAPPSGGDALFLSVMAKIHQISDTTSVAMQKQHQMIQYPFGDKTKAISKQIINKRNFSIWEQDATSHEMKIHFYVEKGFDRTPDIYAMTIQPNK